MLKNGKKQSKFRETAQKIRKTINKPLKILKSRHKSRKTVKRL